MDNFNGAAHKIEDIDLPRLGYEIGVGEDEIHALIDVEAAGNGFDRLGRPKMLFEPHVFYRNLPPGKKRDLAVSMGLAYRTWRPNNYPADSYPRFLKAKEIDETAAFKASSWGMGQILGENAVSIGYDSPQDMVEKFKESEADQLEGIIRFIRANHLDDELRSHNWAGLARGYNGPNYAVNGYDTKLEKAFNKWSKIPDTPWVPSANDNRPERSVIGRGSRGIDVQSWQSILLNWGSDLGPWGADGVFGNSTEKATKEWQKAHGLKPDGVVGPLTWGKAMMKLAS